MYVDTDILYALLKPNDCHLEFAKKILSANENPYTSVITFVELEIVVKREISDFLSQNILDATIGKAPALKIVELNQKILKKSLELRKKFGLGIYDSIHAATAITKDKKIASADHVFDRIKELKRIV